METDYRELEGGGRRGSTKSSSALKGALAAAIVVIIGLAVATGYFASHGGAGGDPHVIDGSSSGSGPSSSSSPDMPEDVEADIRRMMDPSKDPCTDPYGYMCGNFMASTHPTDDNPSIIYGFSNITMQTYQEQFGILRVSRLAAVDLIANSWMTIPLSAAEQFPVHLPVLRNVPQHRCNQCSRVPAPVQWLCAAR